MDQILTTGRDQVAAAVQDRLQDYMEIYNTGIRVARVNVVDAQPPDAVRPAFDDVIRAREDEQRAQNQAQQYANQRIPEARGEAQRQIEQANAYKEEVIAKAEGEASRFDRYSQRPVAAVASARVSGFAVNAVGAPEGDAPDAEALDTDIYWAAFANLMHPLADAEMPALSMNSSV